MQRFVTLLLLFSAAAVSGILITACGSSSSSSPDSSDAATQAAPVEEENNPPGDIPDDQAFVPYHSDAGGYTLDTPEGWARAEDGANVSLSDKLLSISVKITPADAAPTVDSATADEVPALSSQVEAFDLVKVEPADLPSGPAILVRYQSNSAPDPVTGKQVRLEVDRYEIFKDGQLAILSLSAPAGSDNVDVWRQISRSFTWG
jgi:hypothetical protein